MTSIYFDGDMVSGGYAQSSQPKKPESPIRVQVIRKDTGEVMWTGSGAADQVISEAKRYVDILDWDLVKDGVRIDIRATSPDEVDEYDYFADDQAYDAGRERALTSRSKSRD